jgi:glycosyltransferase involved in cell wall biosynthesis
MNTLYSLSPKYQNNVTERDYEVLVIENNSSDQLDPKRVESLGDNFRYLLRHEPRPTPVHAINEGVQLCSSQHICLMIDGARMVTPGIVRNTLDLISAVPNAVVCAPGYHLGNNEYKKSLTGNYNENSEIALLENCRWRNDGYALFKVASFSSANLHGYFHPLMESNCMTFNKQMFQDSGGAHSGFQTPGGGSVNLDIYRNIVKRPESQLFILAGEGSFHQLHGGITTSHTEDLDKILASHRDEMKSIRGEYYTAVLREPIIYGQISEYAHDFLLESSEKAIRRFQRFSSQGDNPWKDDENKL